MLTLLVACSSVQTSPDGKMVPSSGAQESDAPALDNHDADSFNADGELLVDAISPYIVYNVAGFEHARELNKVIFLEFYADWCPYCRTLDPQIRETFKNLNDTDVVGFRVNYDKDIALKKQYNVVYQHTHIVLDRRGNIVHKALETEWDENAIKAAILKAKGE